MLGKNKSGLFCAPAIHTMIYIDGTFMWVMALHKLLDECAIAPFYVDDRIRGALGDSHRRLGFGKSKHQ